MTSEKLGRRYVEEATRRMALVRLAHRQSLWAACVREAQECVELLLKGALRLAGVEPVRSHDVAHDLRAARARFPAWFETEVDALATISTEMAGDRGTAFYGDERQGLGPQELFDERDASRALDNAEHVVRLCQRLLDDLRSS